MIELVQKAIAEDQVAALSDPVIAEWLGTRYRNIFLTEASEDPSALRAAKVPMPIQFIDRRSTRELLAARFLKGVNRQESQAEMPDAPEPKLDGSTLLFVPSLMTGLLPVLAFQSVWPRIEDRFSVRVLTADVHPVRPSTDNVEDIKKAFDRGVGLDAYAEPVHGKAAKKPKDVILVGYSKGATDALTFLVQNPEYRERIRALVGWAPIFGGSYIADEIDLRVEDADKESQTLRGPIAKLLRQIVPVVQMDRVSSRLDEYDVSGAVHDITTDVRRHYLADHLEEINALALPTFTIEGVTSLREVPYYQAMGVLQLNSHDKNNDMFLTVGQTRLPVAHANSLASFRGHHWDLAYDPFPWFTRMGSLNVDHKFARYPAMSAMLLFLNELGLLG